MKEIILIAFLVRISYAMVWFRNVVLALELKISNHVLSSKQEEKSQMAESQNRRKDTVAVDDL